MLDDGTNGSQALWGGYRQGTAAETRHSVGTRLWGERAGWDWNWELVDQAGEFGHGDIRAWSVASDTGYTWQGVALTPRLGLSANIASGDENPDDADLQTFNPLFPRGSYFSEVALLCPRNFYNLHPFLTLDRTDRIAITTDVDFFWQLQTEDAIYSPSGQLLRSGARSDARYVGTEISLNASWQVTDRLALTGVHAHFFPGGFIEETGSSKDIDYLELTMKFQL